MQDFGQFFGSFKKRLVLFALCNLRLPALLVSSCVIFPGKRSFKEQLIEVMQQGIKPHDVC